MAKDNKFDELRKTLISEFEQALDKLCTKDPIVFDQGWANAVKDEFGITIALCGVAGNPNEPVKYISYIIKKPIDEFNDINLHATVTWIQRVGGTYVHTNIKYGHCYSIFPKKGNKLTEKEKIHNCIWDLVSENPNTIVWLHTERYNPLNAHYEWLEFSYTIAPEKAVDQEIKCEYVVRNKSSNERFVIVIKAQIINDSVLPEVIVTKDGIAISDYRDFTMKKHLTVQEVIDRLMKVEDKSKPCSVWINSQTPEPHYSGGDRIPVVWVDDLSNFNVTDICCEYPASRE